jgi:hypothetical protein
MDKLNMMKYRVTFEDNGQYWYEYFNDLNEAHERIEEFHNREENNGLSMRGYILEEVGDE